MSLLSLRRRLKSAHRTHTHTHTHTHAHTHVHRHTNLWRPAGTTPFSLSTRRRTLHPFRFSREKKYEAMQFNMMQEKCQQDGRKNQCFFHTISTSVASNQQVRLKLIDSRGVRCVDLLLSIIRSQFCTDICCCRAICFQQLAQTKWFSLCTDDCQKYMHWLSPSLIRTRSQTVRTPLQIAGSSVCFFFFRPILIRFVLFF